MIGVRRFCLVFACAAVPCAPPAGQAEETRTKQIVPSTTNRLDANNLEQLRAHRNAVVTVEGKIERQGESKNGNVRFLDFKKDYREGFVLVFFTWKGDGKFTKEKLAEYLGKKVRATGKLTEYGSTMQIEVTSLDQLQIIPGS
jgi:hypothetical protein